MRLKHLWYMPAVVLAAACAPIAASSPTTSTISPAPAAPALVIANVRLFDGEDVIPSTTVVVQDGLITDVGNEVATPDGAEVIDGAGKTLLPGLIDAHTHVFGEAELRQALIFGVTTELEMGMDYQVAAELRQEQAATGAVDRADLFSASTVATAPGGHGTQFGLDIRTLSSPQEAEAFVAELVAEGSDFVKIILENGSAWGTSFPSLDQATVAALVQAAHDQGLLTVTHVQTLAAATQALAAGSDGLAHIMVDDTPDETFVENAVAGDLFVVATLVIFQGLGEPVDTSVLEDPHLGPYLTPADVQSLRNPHTELTDLSLANGKAAVRQLFAAGVPILAGTDAPQPGTTHGASLHRELVLLTESGLSPLEALRAATSVTADIFALHDRGRIAPGLRADLLLVNGDPTTAITATRDIVGVWKLGVAADRESYLVQLEAERAAAAEQQASGDEMAERVDFPPGAATVTVSGTLSADSAQNYALAASAGQTVTVETVGDAAQVDFTVYGPGAATWAGEAQAGADNRMTARFAVPETGDYLVTLTAAAAEAETEYEVTFAVEPSAVVRIAFPTAETAIQYSGSLPAGEAGQQFLLSGNAGWSMSIDATSDEAPLSMTIEAPSGVEWIPEMQPTDTGYTIGQQFTLPEAGYYLATVRKDEQTPSIEYTVTFMQRLGN